MAFRASLLVTADAAQAKGELRATAAETAKTTAAMREMGASGDAASAAVTKSVAALQAQAARSAASFHELRAALDPAYRGATQYASAVDVVTAAVRDGSATQAQANAVLGAAEAQFLGLSVAQQAAAAQSAAHQAATAQMVNTFAGIPAAFASAEASARAFEAAIAGAERGFHELRAALDPAYRGATQYAAAVDVVTAAVRAGAATQEQANAVLAMAEAQFLGLTAAQQAAAAQSAAHQAAVAQMVSAFAGIPATFASAEASARAFEAEISRSAAGFHELRAAIDPVYRASKQYEAAMETAAAAVRAGTASQAEANQVMAQAERHFLSVSTGMRGMGQTSGLAGAQLANLGAQFNDIGVMLAAGQSPLQLAMQQGTQIAQVIGPMGAAGAAKMLGAAFMSMLNPVMLITVGSIAAGAAMFQWLGEALPAAIDLGEQLDETDKAIDQLARSTERLSLTSSGSLDEIRKSYGAISDELRRMLQAQRDLDRLEAARDLNKTQSALASSQTDAFPRGIINADTVLRLRSLKEQAAAFENIAAEADITTQQVKLLNVAFARAESAKEPKEKAAAYRALYERIVEVYGGLDKLEDPQHQFLTNLLAAESSARRFTAFDMETPVDRAATRARELADEIARAASSISDMGKSAGARLEDAKIRLEFVDDPVEMARRLGVAQMRRTQAPLRQVAPSEEIAGLDAEAAAYGALAAQIAEADEATRASRQSTRSGLRDIDREREAVVDLIAQERTRLDVLRETDPVRREMLAVADRMTAATDAERAALQGLVGERLRLEDAARIDDLASGLQDELDMMRALDPVQVQMIRLRRQLQGATEGETEAVRKLIELREHGRAMEDVEDFAAGSMYDAFDGVVFRGKDAIDVVDDLAASFANAALKAALMGEGGLAGAFGTSESGGFFGVIAKGIAGAIAPAASAPGSAVSYLGAGNPIMGKKDGGRISGPGTGRSDSIPAWLSDGEYVVNAEATARYLPWLEAMNSGRSLPRYASGGYVAGPPPSAFAPASAPAGGGDGRITLQVINQSSAPVTGDVEETRDASGGRVARLTISDAVGQSLTTPGGGARRTMQRQFGLRQQAPVR